MTRVAVIASGGPALGYGHLHRAKAFALAAERSLAVDFFAVVSGPERGLLPETAIEVASFSQLEQRLREVHYDAVVWDTVSAPHDLVRACRARGALLVSLSPVFDQMKEMSVVFSRNRDLRVPAGVQLRSGYGFAIVGEHCAPIDSAVFEASLHSPQFHVGVAMGGADAQNRTREVLHELSSLRRPTIVWALLGHGYTHSYDDLVAAIAPSGQHEVVLARTRRSVWTILGRCHIAVVAGGVTTVEAMFAGLPTLVRFESESHREAMGREPFSSGATLAVPDGSGALARLVEELDRDRSRLLAMRRAGMSLVDGEASRRIVEELRSMLPIST